MRTGWRLVSIAVVLAPAPWGCVVSGYPDCPSQATLQGNECVNSCVALLQQCSCLVSQCASQIDAAQSACQDNQCTQLEPNDPSALSFGTAGSGSASTGNCTNAVTMARQCLASACGSDCTTVVTDGGTGG
jgi:hypothetical protein